MTHFTAEERRVLASYQGQLRRIAAVARSLRRASPRNVANPNEPADILVKEERLRGRPVKAVNITLTPTGCAWARSGGCTMCGEWAGSTGGQLVPPQVHVSQLEAAIRKVGREDPLPSWLRIYQEGNYTNTDETSLAAQQELLRRASLPPWIERITVETMASRVTKDAIRSLRESVRDDVELEVGLGFEAADPVVRNVCINKGESIEDYSRAAEILRDCGCRSLAYVLVKPPFLTEAEGVSHAIDTANAAAGMGFDAVSIEPVSVHEWSLVGALHFFDLYRTPWIWSIVEVTRRVSSEISAPSGLRPELRIGGYEYYPHPSELAHNYHDSRVNRDCSGDAWKHIRKFNEMQDVGAFDGFECRCIADWTREKDSFTPPEWSRIFAGDLPAIGERIVPLLDRIDLAAYLAHLRGAANVGGGQDA